MKDLAFLPLGVGDGERGRLEEAEEWLDIKRKKGRKSVNREERKREYDVYYGSSTVNSSLDSLKLLVVTDCDVTY